MHRFDVTNIIKSMYNYLLLSVIYTALEKRTFLNINNLNEYNKSLKDLKALFNENVDDVTLLDTSNINMNEVSIIIASNIMEAMRKKYIDCFKKTYKIVKSE